LELEKLKELVTQEIDAHRQELIDLSLRIHSNPELGFEERRASAWLTDYLEGKGFEVERGLCELPTAFRASYGSGKPTIAILAEYDALPQIGHGCGHNIIAASAVGAGVATKVAIDQLGGCVSVMGTPAEELYGGKAIMAEGGAFEGVDVAMMVHPGVIDTVITQALACVSLEVEFFGQAAHAAAQPEKGINALEAMILAFNGINSLRQHIKDKARVHGIITDGGQAANIVPAHSRANFLVRAEDNAYLDDLKERVLNCFKAAALASGARLEYRWGERYYAPLRTNQTLAETFAKNLEALGHRPQPPEARYGFGSTDMGNVSQMVPSIHPFLAIASTRVSTHSVEFLSAAASETGHQGLIDAAKAMAMTATDLLATPETLAKVREEFLQSQ
jgi:amidohydrolase